MGTDEDRSRIEDALYYLHLMAGRRFSGSITLWMYDGRISRSTMQKLRAQCRLAGIPYEAEADEVTSDAR